MPLLTDSRETLVCLVPMVYGVYKPQDMVITYNSLLLQTIDFELRKLDAQQAAEQINLLKAFMPSSFLIGGGQ